MHGDGRGTYRLAGAMVLSGGSVCVRGGGGGGRVWCNVGLSVCYSTGGLRKGPDVSMFDVLWWGLVWHGDRRILVLLCWVQAMRDKGCVGM